MSFSSEFEKYAARIKREEAILIKKLIKKDSTLAHTLLAENHNNENKSSRLHQQLNGLTGDYSGRLDSLTMALRFFQSEAGLPGWDKAQLEQSLAGLEAFKDKLEGAHAFENILQQRSALLQQQVQRLGMMGDMRKFSKTLYYYGAQVDYYEQLFESPQNAELALLQAVSKIPQFRKFFAANAQLARLFALPDPGSAAVPSLAGLQTLSTVGALLSDRFGPGVSMERFLPAAHHGNLGSLKNAVEQFKEGQWGNGPKDPSEIRQFKPNGQKAKSLGDRLELGANFQSQKSSHYFPVTSHIALQLGFKLNDKSVVGIGAAYKVGWGSGWNNIRISHQGFGLRSFLDWQLKGSIYISGGYEQHYNSAFKSFSILKQYSAWQSSGLIGVSRKFKTGKLKANMQLLWDFLADRQVPRTQPLVWRIGYSLK